MCASQAAIAARSTTSVSAATRRCGEPIAPAPSSHVATSGTRSAKKETLRPRGKLERAQATSEGVSVNKRYAQPRAPATVQKPSASITSAARCIYPCPTSRCGATLSPAAPYNCQRLNRSASARALSNRFSCLGRGRVYTPQEPPHASLRRSCRDSRAHCRRAAGAETRLDRQNQGPSHVAPALQQLLQSAAAVGARALQRAPQAHARSSERIGSAQ